MLKCLLFCGAFIILVVFTIYSPPIDYTLSVLPYNYALHVFYGETQLWCRIIYLLVPVIVVTISITLLLLFVFRKRLPYKVESTNRFVIIVLLSLIIGPGLISNTLFKNHWGRPRPYQVLRDHQEFRAVYKPNFSQPYDNSFPSGHATIGFFLGIPFLVLGRRKLSIIVSIFGGSIIGLVRILQGGHYLSDVVFSGVIVWVTAILVIYMYDKFMRV